MWIFSSSLQVNANMFWMTFYLYYMIIFLCSSILRSSNYKQWISWISVLHRSSNFSFVAMYWCVLNAFIFWSMHLLEAPPKISQRCGGSPPPPLSSNILREPVLPYEAQSKWYHIDAPLFHVLFPKFPSHPCCSIPQSGVYAWALSHDQESRRDHWEGGWVVWELLQGRCHLSLNGQDKSFFKVVLKAFCFYLRVSLTCM